MAKPIGPYSPIVRAGEWLITSGQLGLDPTADTPTLVKGDTAAQFSQALENGRTLLEENGASLSDVVRTAIFLTDLGDYAAINEVYVSFFGDHRPARSAIGVASLPMGAAIEVELWAIAPKS
jgi:2-iminobutanoate/2-iminopropanoate deaminase